MSSFADFAFLAVIPSYGGAEILRAQRVSHAGVGPRVHLALLGRSNAIARRVVDVATSATGVDHPALARILEVGRFDGIVYGVAEPAEGVDAAALLVGDKSRRPGLPADLALSIGLAVSRIALDLQQSGGAWAAAGKSGLTLLFPAGLDPTALFLEPSGAVRLRVLVGAAADPSASSVFRAANGDANAAADVYGIGRLLMALLAGDATGIETPRLPAGSPLLPFLTSLIDPRANHRPQLNDVVQRLTALVADMGAPPEDVVSQALAGPYRSLVVGAGDGLVPAARVVDDIRSRLNVIYRADHRLFPLQAGSALALPMAALPPVKSDEGGAVFTAAHHALQPRRVKTAATIIMNDINSLAASARKLRVTSPTLMILPSDLKALAVAAALEERIDKTTIIDPANFSPRLPSPPRPPPPPPMATAPPSPSGPPMATLPRSPTNPSTKTVVASGRVITVEAAQAGNLRATNTGSLRLPLPPTTPAPPPPALPAPVRVPQDDSENVFAAPYQSQNAVFAGDEPEEHTILAPAPAALFRSSPSQRAHDRPDRPDRPNTQSVSPSNGESLLPVPTPVDDGEDDGEDDGDYGEHTAVMSNIPDISDEPELDKLDRLDDVDELADAGSFQMVGEAGRTFREDDNPFNQPTRMIPAQALLRARSESVEGLHSDETNPVTTTEALSAQRLRKMMQKDDAVAVIPAVPTLSQGRASASAPLSPRTPLPASTPARPSLPALALPERGGHVLLVDAPDGATVAINGKVVGTGKVSIDVDANARALVRVELAGFLPWSSVVKMQGRPRVRVRSTLKQKV